MLTAGATAALVAIFRQLILFLAKSQVLNTSPWFSMATVAARLINYCLCLATMLAPAT